MDYLQKALSLFDNGIPTHQDYVDKILVPRKELSVIVSRKDSSKIDAVGYYIDAYNGLLAGEVNMACILLLDDRCFDDDMEGMPAIISLGRLRDLRATVVDDDSLAEIINSVKDRYDWCSCGESDGYFE